MTRPIIPRFEHLCNNGIEVTMTAKLTRVALATMLAMIAGSGIAQAQGRRGGMVGNRGGGGGGGANAGFRGSPSFSARPRGHRLDPRGMPPVGLRTTTLAT